MQFKSDFTQKELTDGDPISFACHSIGKLKTIAELMIGLGHNEVELDTIKTYGIHDIILDAAEEIEYLIDCHYKKIRRT